MFRGQCFDNTPNKRWKHQPRASKKALPPSLKEKRLAWASAELVLVAAGQGAGWFYRHIVWTDLCATILPRTEAKATEQALAKKGKKGWLSDDAKLSSLNLQGAKERLVSNARHLPWRLSLGLAPDAPRRACLHI